MAEELLGQVVVWNEQKKFGFIEYSQSGDDHRRMFFIRESCQPDALGRISDCFVAGTLVKFSIERQIHRGEGRLIATDVRPVFRTEFTGDLDTYRENGQIVKWLIEHKNGFLQRPSGEHIYFQAGDVVPGHEYQFRSLVDGDWLYFAIKSQVRNGVLVFRAKSIECYSDQEQSRLRQGLPLLEPAIEQVTESLAPPLEPEPASVLLAPENRKKSLTQLIKEKRNGNSR